MHAKSQLSVDLQERCIGGTFDRRQTRKAWFESMSRPEQVILDVIKRNPPAWIAVDDWPEGWPDWTSPHAVRADPTHGLAECQVLSDLRVKLDCQFGSP
ncbi:HAD domain-containing protein [Cupriavidus sp. D384]|uniref:HAD domain-containing protein n=1 Tax=Cupriavidus sp. D384 TaxID=1538095 RepID=UPI0018D42D54